MGGEGCFTMFVLFIYKKKTKLSNINLGDVLMRVLLKKKHTHTIEIRSALSMRIHF